MAHKKDSPSYLVRPSTAVITRGFDPQLSVGSARPAVFRSSTYVFSSPEAAERSFEVALGRSKPVEGENIELIYSRLSHPNSEILETHIVHLEPQAQAAAVFNSGLAAISNIAFTFCSAGSHFIYTSPLYGGTYHLFNQIFAPLNIRGISVCSGETQNMIHVINNTSDLSMIFIETPSNPTLRMTNIVAAVEAAANHKNKPLVVVDNTFMGPAFQHPLVLGADLVVYSATKYLSGFSDMLAGVVLGKEKKHIELLQGTRAMLGNILQPDECWLLDSRLPTVLLRMNRQSKNAQRIVEALSQHSQIKEVLYPSLFKDPEQIQIRDLQCEYPGAIFSFRVKGGKKAAFDFLRNLELIKNAVSLGGMESLSCHPASTTHAEMKIEDQRKCGVDDSLIRISVGVEDWRDLLEDCEQALRQLSDTTVKS